MAGQSSANAGAALRLRKARAAPIGAPIHQSLVNPVLIAGMERGPAITLLTAIVTLILGPGFHIYTLALAAGLLLVGPWCLAKLANYDPQLEAIIIRYAAYDRVYDADVPYYPAPAGWLESWTSFTGQKKNAGGTRSASRAHTKGNLMIFNELRLPKSRRQARHGTPELMPYSHLVAEGVPMLKDGSLLRSFRMYGPDLKAASEDQLLAVKYHANATFTRLADGWMVQSDLVRFYSTDYIGGGPLPDPVTQLIENQRQRHYRAYGGHLETALSMSITYRPPSEAENRARRLFITDPVSDDERNLQYFREITDAFAHDLAAHLRLEPMNSDEALSFYESCILGEQVQVRAPKLLNYLDTLIGRHRLVVSRKPTIGERAIRVVVPTGFPLEAHAEIVDFICELPFPLRYSVRAILLGTQTAGRVISKVRMTHIQKQKRKWDFLVETTGTQSTPTYLNEHAVNMAHDATQAAAEIESNLVREVYLSFGVVIIDPDPRQAEAKAEYVRAQFSHHRFNARTESFNTIEAWRGFVPGDGFSNRRKPPVNTMNLSDLTCMRTTWTGNLYSPNPMYPPKTPPLFYATTEGQTPFRFHWHVSDVGHGAIFGPVAARYAS